MAASAARTLRRWFLAGFLLALLSAAALALFGAIRGAGQWLEARFEEGEEPAPPAVRDLVKVTLSGGATVYLEPRAVQDIQAEARDWTGLREAQIREGLAAEALSPLDALHGAAVARIPDFADWYYSLPGEYVRLFHAAAGDLPGLVANRLDELVFAPAGTSEGVAALVHRLDERAAEGLRGATRDLQAFILKQVGRHAVAPDQPFLRVQGEWSLAAQFSEHLLPYAELSDRDLARQGAAGSAGALAAAAAAKKLGAAGVAKATGTLAGTAGSEALAGAAAKLGLKSAAKAGVAGAAGAATGGALCAGTLIGAPLAPGCALLGGLASGLATWLLVDAAVLEADEALTRDDLEAELRAALDAYREDLRASLEARYAQAIASGIGTLRAELDRHILPAPPLVPAQQVKAAADLAR